MKSHIPTLKKILAKAHISPMLHQAIEDTIQALQTDNLDLAYQLTVVKSFITGRLEPHNKEHAFQEDHAYNKKQLKESVYALLDGIHHDIAWKLDAMPSGMMIMSVGPKGPAIQEMKPTGTHPIVKRIKLEQNRIHKQFSTRRF